MKQIIGFALVSFLAAVGGATWYTAYLSPPPAAPVHSVDSAPPQPNAVTSRPSDTAPAASQPAKEPVAPGFGKPSPSPSDLAGRTERAKAVGKVLASMKPKDAVSILEKMTDQDVERIVRQLNAKQMASLFSAMPAERAALLGRRLLQPAVPQ